MHGIGRAAPSRTPMNHISSVLVSLLLAALSAFGSAAWADELSEVNRMFRSGQSAAALLKADQFLAAKPKDPSMRFLKGVMLADSQRASEAIDMFRKLSEDYPELAEPYNNIAALHAARGDYDQARAALEQALRTNPSYAVAHENLGDVHAMLASQSYARALKLDPGNITVPPKLVLVRELFAHKARPASGEPAPAAPAQ
jgi:tetratricopeptide (TPR) repeat protein